MYRVWPRQARMGARPRTDSGSFSNFYNQITVYLKVSVGPEEANCHSNFNDNALAQAQENDESLNQDLKWIRNKRVPKKDDLQGLPH